MHIIPTIPKTIVKIIFEKLKFLKFIIHTIKTPAKYVIKIAFSKRLFNFSFLIKLFFALFLRVS